MPIETLVTKYIIDYESKVAKAIADTKALTKATENQVKAISQVQAGITKSMTAQQRSSMILQDAGIKQLKFTEASKRSVQQKEKEIKVTMEGNRVQRLANDKLQKLRTQMLVNTQVAKELTLKEKLAMGMWAEAFPTLKMANAAMNTLRWSMVNVGFALAGIAAIAVPFVLIGKKAAEAEEKFTHLSLVANQSIEAVAEASKQLQRGTPFSLIEISSAMLEVSKRGYDLSDSLKITKASTVLAVGGFTDLATATDLITTSLKQFNLSAKDAMHLSNVFAEVANKTAADVSTLATAFSYVGPVAAAFGASAEETAVTLGLLQDRGLKASMAGTTLRGMLNRMISPSAEVKDSMDRLGFSFSDSEGNVKTLSRSLRGLGDALKVIPTEAKKLEFLSDLFGIRPQAGGLALLSILEETPYAIDRFVASTLVSNAALDNFNKSMLTTSSRFKTLKEEISVSLTELGGGPKGLLDSVLTTSDQRRISSLSSELFRAIQNDVISLDEIVEKFGLSSSTNILSLNTELVKLYRNGTPVLSLFENFNELLSESKEEKLGKILEEGLSDKDLGKRIKEFFEPLIKGEEQIEDITKRTIDTTKGYQITLFELANAYVTNTDLLKNNGMSMENVLDIITRLSDATKENKREVLERLQAIRQEESATDRATKASQTYSNFLEVMNDLESESKSEIENLASAFEDKLVKAIEEATIAMKNNFIAGNIDVTRSIAETILELDKLKQSIPEVTEELIKKENEINRLTSELEEAKLVEKEWNIELSNQQDILDSLNDKLQKRENNISKLLNRRFSGQTDAEKQIYGVELALKKEQLRMLELDMSTKKVGETIRSETNAFKAWSDTIKEFIRAAITEGVDLGSDVTGIINTFQTKLLGISAMSDNPDIYTKEDELNDKLKKLKLQYDINYGDMQKQVEFTKIEHDELANGIANNSEEIISALQSEWTEISKLTTQIETQTSVVDFWKERVDSMKSSIENLTLEIERMNIELEKGKKSLTYSSNVGNVVLSESERNADIKQRLIRAGKDPDSYYTKFASGGIVNSPTRAIVGEAGPEAIIPLNSSSGQQNGININIDMNVNGSSSNINAQEIAARIATEIKRELATLG